MLQRKKPNSTNFNNNKEQITKPPVVVVLGHIDHGKTSLLLAIRNLQFTGEKPGGIITQHIGAYQIKKNEKKITFIDTPGHEAFSALRARGAKIADIAVLVVDSCEGPKEQTKEAISQAKLAGIPIIVALNKIDKPQTNPEKTKRELAQLDILVEGLGGKIPSIMVSAKTGQGIQDLLELILLVAEMEELKAPISKPAKGIIIESYLDNKRGPVATLILNQGILKREDVVGTSSCFGKIKILEDFKGKIILEVLPGDPAVVVGFQEVAKAGENFQTFENIETAQNYLEKKEQKVSEVLEILPEQKVWNLILKADVLGSLEAIENILKEFPKKEIVLRILKSEVGQINENDIKLAKSAKARILGFRVKANPIIKNLAEREKIKIITFEVIYELVEGVRNLIEKMTKPTIIRTDLGKMKALIIFLTEKNRQIIGGKVIEGKIKKGTLLEIFRNEEKIGQGKMVNLQKNKKDAEIVPKGEEAGILFEGETKVQENDILLSYEFTSSKD